MVGVVIEGYQVDGEGRLHTVKKKKKKKKKKKEEAVSLGVWWGTKLVSIKLNHRRTGDSICLKGGILVSDRYR